MKDIRMGCKATPKFTCIPLNILKKYKLDMTRNILSLTIQDRVVDPPKKLIEPLKRVHQSLYKRTRALGFFLNNKELNLQSILRYLHLNYPLLQGVHFIIGQTKLFFNGSHMKDLISRFHPSTLYKLY